MTDQDHPTRPDDEHRRAERVHDATVAALGRLSDPLEAAEEARGRDDGYFSVCESLEAQAREELVDRRHRFETKMKENERTPGRAGHTASPKESQ